MRSNAEIEAYDIANILNNMMDTVRNNLVLLSGISTIQNQDVESSKKLFSVAQRTTSNTTSSYFWLDRDDKLLWAMHLIIGQYMTSKQETTESMDVIFLNLEVC
jgi:hypothetical protein